MLKLIGQIGFWTAAVAVVILNDKAHHFAREASLWIAGSHK
jgi:hypothetical protein